MELLQKWNRISLVKRIIIGLFLGAVLGVALPSATVIGVLGTLFVGALKALAPLLVFSWSCTPWPSISRAPAAI